MGWNFRKSINLGHGLKLNLGKKGVSLSQKIGNTTITHKQNGDIKGTINIPKTGISYSKTIKKKK